MARQPLPQPPPEVGHVWNYNSAAHRFVCEQCLAVARTRTQLRRRAFEECPGSSEKLSAVLRATPFVRHKLEAFVYRQQVGVICLNCGAHSSFRVDLLSLSCLRAARSRRGKDGLKRYARGLHPHERYSGELSVKWSIPPRANDPVDDPVE